MKRIESTPLTLTATVAFCITLVFGGCGGGTSSTPADTATPSSAASVASEASSSSVPGQAGISSSATAGASSSSGTDLSAPEKSCTMEEENGTVVVRYRGDIGLECEHNRYFLDNGRTDIVITEVRRVHEGHFYFADGEAHFLLDINYTTGIQHVTGTFGGNAVDCEERFDPAALPVEIGGEYWEVHNALFDLFWFYAQDRADDTTCPDFMYSYIPSRQPLRQTGTYTTYAVDTSGKVHMITMLGESTGPSGE